MNGRGQPPNHTRTSTNQVAILNLGTRLASSVEAARKLELTNPDIGVTVADARFMKPLDIVLIRALAEEHSVLVTIEEGSVGGFGDHVLHFLALDGQLDKGTLKVVVWVGLGGKPTTLIALFCWRLDFVCGFVFYWL